VVEPIFLDTSALIALNSLKDLCHPQAIRVRNELARDGLAMVTTDMVLTEFLAGFAQPPFRTRAVQVVEKLRASPLIDVVPSARIEWDEAFSLYKRRSDKAWSLTDCASIILCGRLAIKRVFTADDHFAQAGFFPLLDPRIRT
jgi:predicted nucleic acid-binding protein